MIIRVDLVIDTTTGVYDVKFINESNPGEEVDLNIASELIKKVMENVVSKKEPTTEPEIIDAKKLN